MPRVRLNLRLFGGKADKAEFSASRAGDVLRGIAADFRDLCRNLSEQDSDVPWKDKEASCHVSVLGAPQAGKSLTWTFALPENPPTDWGEITAQSYVEGIEILRGVEARHEPKLPRGFDHRMVSRIHGYLGSIRAECEGAEFEVAANGRPATAVVMDATLQANLAIKLALIKEAAPAPAAHSKVAGYTLHGVMYELSDQDYENPDGIIKVEVDPHDGTRWVCSMKRSLAPSNIQEYWRSSVVLEGTATFRPHKPLLDVEKFKAAKKLGPLDAIARLRVLVGDLSQGESLDDIMNSLRGRE